MSRKQHYFVPNHHQIIKKNPTFKKFGSAQHLRYISSRAMPIFQWERKTYRTIKGSGRIIGSNRFLQLFIIINLKSCNLYSLCHSGCDKESNKKKFKPIGLIVFEIFGNKQTNAVSI